MSGVDEMWLHSSSVVITADSHNPSILNKDFLVMHKIVPKEWNVIKAIVTPGISIIEYENGIQWTIDQQRLRISQEHDAPFSRYGDSRVYDLADTYVETLPHVPYRSLGLNCVLSIVREDPSEWITDRFLKIDRQDADLRMMPRLSMSLGDMTLNLSLDAGDAKREGSLVSLVIIDCNLHRNGPFDAESLRGAIRQWRDAQNQIAAKLYMLLGVQ